MAQYLPPIEWLTGDWESMRTNNFRQTRVERHSTGPKIEQLSADWESSITVISADQQSNGTVQYSTELPNEQLSVD